MIVELEPHTDAWYAWRLQGIGGSDAPVVTGDDTFRSSMSLWLEKSGHLQREHDSDDEPQYWGRTLEPALIQRFERDTGLYVVERQVCYQHDVDGWRRATVDGLVADHQVREPFSAGVLGILETKTTSRVGRWDEGMPADVQIQTQHNLEVSGFDHAWVAVLFTAPIVHFKLYELERDESITGPLRELEARFWRRVLEGDAPPASSADLEDLKRAYDLAVADRVQLDPSAAELILALDGARSAERYAKDYVEGICAQLAAMLKEHEVGVIDGEPAINWKMHQKTYVDLEAIRAAAPALVEQHTSKRPYRQFTIPKRQRPLVAGSPPQGDDDGQ